ncbi:NAD(P)/FAD-dependent oxidoreductase [Moheibacter sediminis]|uniref:Thioredoxin reductase n=1 Tax=Moheibacter sediminis TaxID=1434700 RepID=A0A1W1Z957_9FLAO|nr:NAD(P)/FAD-dependent oxidoreductase [Moheibacter sediminis]SMC44935.1 Thioredoxin reductase [Moheibacter sediminis]
MKIYDVIIIGGSMAGLSAALTLGRSVRTVLVIDGGKPCNRFTPHSHNFLTQDGIVPNQILETAKSQILKYETVEFYDGEVQNVVKDTELFIVDLSSEGRFFHSKKVIFATGLKDNLADIQGLKDCWGISAIHCPYCHGYEFKQVKTGILANTEAAFHYAKLVGNLTDELSIFNNGISEFTNEQSEYLKLKGIQVIENKLIEVQHKDGFIKGVQLDNDQFIELNALYVRPDSEQSCKIPESLGCELNPNKLLVVDIFQKTNVEGIFACGDNSNMFRSVSAAVASGNMAGASVNMELCN